MRTIILFLGLAGILCLTGGFINTNTDSIFALQRFDFMTVINAIPAPIWIITIILDIVKR